MIYTSSLRLSRRKFTFCVVFFLISNCSEFTCSFKALASLLSAYADEKDRDNVMVS